jgi:folate-binding protein YgfZ
MLSFRAMGSAAHTPGLAENYKSFSLGEKAVRLEGWTVLRLEGPDTESFLQGLASQDLSRGSSRRTYFLTEKGRPLALAWVRLAEDGASSWVVADEGPRDSLLPHLERFHVMEEVEIRDAREGLVVLGVAGGNVSALLTDGSADRPGIVRLEAEPMSIVLAAPDDAAGLPQTDPAVFEPWRVATGLPRAGVDFDLDRIATEVRDPGAISLTKGCYVGQEVVARTSNRGQVRRGRVGFRFDGAHGPLRSKCEIRRRDTPVGFVTSSALEPGTWEGVAMGYLSTEIGAGASDLVAVQGDTTIPLRESPWGSDRS